MSFDEPLRCSDSYRECAAEIRRLEQQRDELLAAGAKIVKCLDTDWKDAFLLNAKLRDVIAKIKEAK